MTRTVIVVDDHPSFRRCVRALLVLEGFEVVGEAEDGERAIALVPELAPEVVLLDVQLPDLDGFEVAARLAALGLPSAVVLTSSRNAAEYGRMVAETPVRGFIPKSDLSGALLAGFLSP